MRLLQRIVVAVVSWMTQGWLIRARIRCSRCDYPSPVDIDIDIGDLLQAAEERRRLA